MNYDSVYMENRCKVIVLGRTGAGKTCLLTYLRQRTFESDGHRTLGIEQFHQRFSIRDKVVDANIWDTCGQERFRSIGKTYYKGSQGALLVFDLTDRASLASLPWYIEDFKNNCDRPDAVCVLVGTKADLEPEVTFKEAIVFAQTHGIRYFETSAKTGQNIESALEPILLASLISESIDSHVNSIKLSIQTPKIKHNRDKCRC